MGHSRASRETPFDSLRMISYYHPIVTLCLYNALFSRYCDILVENHLKKPTTLSFGTFIWRDSLRNFRRVIPCQKVKSWSYLTVYISRSCFCSARLSTGCDRQTDGRTRPCRKDRAMHSVVRVKMNKFDRQTFANIKQ